MVVWLLRPGRMVVRALTAADSPREIAWGCALGMLVGLVPKGNLLAMLLAVLVLVSRSNLGAAGLAAFAFTWVGLLLDPLSDRIGSALLTLDCLQSFWTWLYNQPLAPWTAFNNTVVLGSLVLGLLLCLPVHLATRRAAAWAVPKLAARLQKYHLGKLLLGLEVVAGGGAA